MEAFRIHSVPTIRRAGRLIRYACLIVSLAATQLTTGCQWARWIRPVENQPPGVFQTLPTREQIVQRVNANSKAIRSMQARVHVRATGTPTLSGDLTVEQPSRLRMQVGLLNMPSSGIDLGSNDTEFWVWMKTALPGQPPAVYFAKHDEYETSAARKVIPIEPAWVIDSLGLAYFDPRADHSGPFQRPDGSLEIQSRFETSAGRMIKSTIVDPKSSVVIGQELYQGKTKIASSRASRHQYFPDIDASIPQLVEIEIGLNSSQPGKVTIDLSRINPNSIDESYAGLWEMPRPRNINMIDLAKIAPAAQIPGPPQYGSSPNNFSQPRFSQTIPPQGNFSQESLRSGNPVPGGVRPSPYVNPNPAPNLQSNGTNQQRWMDRGGPATASSDPVPRYAASPDATQNRPRNFATPGNFNRVQNASYEDRGSPIDDRVPLPRGFGANQPGSGF